MVARIPHWIDGQEHKGTSGRTGPVYNPATGEQTGAVDLAGPDDVNAAVASAVAAAATWRTSSLSRRAAVLFAFRELLHEQAARLADILTAEHGKVRADALGEVARGLENVEFATAVPQLLKGGHSESVADGLDVHSTREPLGVVVGITPFNFPAMVPLWMCANAIACGNAFVLKPSEKDPSASLYLARLWQQAGLPDGVFTVLQGDREAVDALLGPPRRRRGQLRRLDPRRPAHLRARHGRPQAGPGPRRCEEPRRRAPGRRPRPGRGRHRQRGIRVGR